MAYAPRILRWPDDHHHHQPCPGANVVVVLDVVEVVVVVVRVVYGLFMWRTHTSTHTLALSGI